MVAWLTSQKAQERHFDFKMAPQVTKSVSLVCHCDCQNGGAPSSRIRCHFDTSVTSLFFLDCLKSIKGLEHRYFSTWLLELFFLMVVPVEFQMRLWATFSRI